MVRIRECPLPKPADPMLVRSASAWSIQGLLQQAQYVVGQLVGLCEHGGTGLLQDL